MDRRRYDPYALGDERLDSQAALQLQVTYQGPLLWDVELKQDADGDWFLRPGRGPGPNTRPSDRAIRSCFGAFLALRTAADDPERVRGFARRYGLLGFCEHYRVARVGAAPPWLLARECADCQRRGRFELREPVAAWVALARHLHAIRRLTAALRTDEANEVHADQRHSFSPELLQALRWARESRAYLEVPGDLEERPDWISPEELAHEITAAVNFWLDRHRTQSLLQLIANRKRPGHFTMRWTVRVLREHLISQIVAIISAESGMYACSIEGCGEIIESERRPRLYLCKWHMDKHRRAQKAASAKRSYDRRRPSGQTDE